MSNSEINEYPEITEHGYIKEDKVYLKGYHGFQDREVGIVRESEEESLKYFVNRFEMVKKKVEEVRDAVGVSENKGSFLMKLIHMRSYLAQYNGLGDFESLFSLINNLEDEINTYIQKNRVKNFDIKKSILSEVESLKESTDWKYASIKLKELKLNWIKTGSAHKEDEEDLSERFNEAIEYFFNRRKDFFAEQARISRERETKYHYLLDEVRFINRKGGGPPFVQRVKDIQQEWKSVGRIQAFKYKKVLYEFKKEIQNFFYKLKSQQDSDFKPKTSLEIKKELYAEIEEVLNSHYPTNISQIKKIQNQWKNLGKLSEPEDKDLNLKFRIACNEIFETHFLEKTASYFNNDLYDMPMHEQAKIKINLLEDSIRKDQDELNEFNNKHFYELSQPRDANNSQLQQQRNNFVNRLKTKQRILKKLEGQLP